MSCAYLLFCFCYAGGGGLMIPNHISYSYHAVDYSMGFCTKFLPGALYNFIVGIYTKEALTVYLNILFAVSMVFIIFILEKFILMSPEEYRFECCIITVLFLTGPFTFSMFQKILCMLDYYWVILFALGYVLLRRKYLKFFVPVLLLAMILVHYASMVCYVAALLLLMLFFAVNTTQKGERVSYIVLFLICGFVSAGAALYFIAFEENNLVYSIEEFDKIMTSRGATYQEYYDYVLYRYVAPDTSVTFGIETLEAPHTEGSFLKNVFYQISTTIRVSNTHILDNLIVNGSVYLLGAAFYAFAIRTFHRYFFSVGDKAKKAVTVLMGLLTAEVLAIGVLFSTDKVRWLGHSIIIMLVFLMTVLAFDGRKLYEYIHGIFSRISRELIVIFCTVYAFVYAYPYFY